MNTTRNTTSLILSVFVGILFTILVAMFFERRNNKKAKELQDHSNVTTFKVLEDLEKNLNREIIQHYEKIDSIIIVRDSINLRHGTKSIVELQKSIDSLFNYR